LEVVEVVKGSVFDAEVVNYKRDGNATGVMAEQHGGGCLVTPARGEVADEAVLG
jgi:hypothetical protein